MLPPTRTQATTLLFSNCQVSESLPSPFNSSKVTLWTSMIPLSKVGSNSSYYHVANMALIIWYGNRFIPETVRHRRRGRTSRRSRYSRPGRIRVRIVDHINQAHDVLSLFPVYTVPCENSTCGPVKVFYSSTRSPRGTRLRKSARFDHKICVREGQGLVPRHCRRQ